MKKYIITVIILLIATCAVAKEKDSGVSLSKLNAVISEYSLNDGFDVVNVGKIGTMAIKSLIRLGAMADGDNDDARAALNLISGIKKIAIVDYDDCQESVRKGFEHKLSRILTDKELIMEAKDGGDIMKIYGVIDDKADKLGNFVMYAPQDCALICLFGTIPLSAIASAME